MIELTLSISAILLSIVSVGVTIYVANINRRTGIRQKLYDEQFSVIKRLHLAALAVENALDDFMLFAKESDANKKRQFQMVFDTYMEMLSVRDELRIYFDDEFDHKLSLIFKKISTIRKKVTVDNETEVATSDVFNELEDTIREFLGVDALSAENRKISNSDRR